MKKIADDKQLEKALKRILILMTKKKTESQDKEYRDLIENVKAYETEKLGEDVVNQADLDHFNKIQAA